MQDPNDARYDTGNPVCDALRFVGDAAYAVLPRDVAHQLADFQKNIWGGVRWLAEKRIEWIDDNLRGGDRLREEWQRRRADTTAGGAPTPPPGETAGGL
ncbi:MAG TPA: hypothetical protein VGV38_17420 [Pyrinomonadaceae bacterium]|nr:hypothetical protein [Pyrinomonadaceae bacterium]